MPQLGPLQITALWATIVTTIIFLAAVIFAWTQWKSSQNARMAQIILCITERWESLHMEESRQKISEIGGDKLKQSILDEENKNSLEYFQLTHVANFFDSLGCLVSEGFINCKLCYKLFGKAEENYFGLYKAVLEEQRYKDALKYFQELHELFKAVSIGKVKIMKERI